MRSIHGKTKRGISLLALAMVLACPVSASDAPPAEPTGPLAKLQGLTSRASELALQAMSMIGIRYKYGGNAPESGLDCSGLVRYVFKQVKVRSFRARRKRSAASARMWNRTSCSRETWFSTIRCGAVFPTWGSILVTIGSFMRRPQADTSASNAWISVTGKAASTVPGASTSPPNKRFFHPPSPGTAKVAARALRQASCEALAIPGLSPVRRQESQHFAPGSHFLSWFPTAAGSRYPRRAIHSG